MTDIISPINTAPNLGTNSIDYTITLRASTVPCKKTRHFGYFPYKMAIFTRVKKHLKVLEKPPFFHQFIAVIFSISFGY